MNKTIRDKLIKESNELFNMDDRLDNILDKIEFREKNIKKSFNFQYVLYPVLVLLLCFTSIISFKNLLGSKNSSTNSSSEVITKPKSFDEVKYVYDFSYEFDLDRGEVIYLKVQVDKGMIVSNIKDIDMELYDENKEFVTESIGDQLGHPYKEFEAFLPVEEEGTYYLVITHWSLVDSKLNLKFYSYDTVIDKEGIDLSKISSYEGEIEGKYDFDKFVIKVRDWNYDKKSVKIHNTGNSNIYVYYENSLYNPVLEIIAPDQIKYIGTYNYINNVFICNDFRSSEDVNEYKYSMDIDVVDLGFKGEIYETNIPSQIMFEPYQNINYHTFLKRGAYSFTTVDDTFHNLDVAIYNNDGVNLNANIVNYNDCYDQELAANFVIKEDGYYYVNLENNISMQGEYCFNSYNYETIFDRDNPFMVDVSGGYNSGELEGANDFECYLLNNDTKNVKVYSLKNESSHPIMLILRKNCYADMRQTIIESNDTLLFPSYPGGMEIIVSNNYRKYNNYEYSDYAFSVEEIENNNQSKSSKEIEYITEEYSSKYYLVGFDVSEAYFKLKIEEECLLSFEYEKYYDSSIYPQFILEDKKNNVISYSSRVKPGEYYVRVVANSHVFNKIKVKCTKIT